MQLLYFVMTDRVVPFPSDEVQQMCASGRALRGFQAGPHSSLQFLDRQPACLQNRALIAGQPESQSAPGVVQRLPSVRCPVS